MSLFGVLAQTHRGQGRVEVVVRGVDVAADVADPLLAVVDEPDEGIHVSTAIFASHYGLLTVSY